MRQSLSQLHHYPSSWSSSSLSKSVIFPLLTSPEKLEKIEVGQCRDLHLWLAQAKLETKLMYVHNTYLNNNGTIHLLEWKDNTHAISLFSCYRISMAFYLLKPCITLYFSFAFWQVQWLMELKDIPWNLVKLYILTELSCYSFYNYSLAELQVSFSSWLCHGKFQVSVAVLKLVGTFF